ncbi:hypothetical protein [Ornithinibacillus scapharcae]|uniref:hypothetical protein n=1 Tax=Ornithinibacillus scapharcae TaxID=1147159 RepID=UPI000225B014|nr:hypothetical protein [Ornithinibacillus scapharcae]
MSSVKKQDIAVHQWKELKLVCFRVLCPGDEYVVEIPKATFLLAERMDEIKHVSNPKHMYGAFVVENESAN